MKGVVLRSLLSSPIGIMAPRYSVDSFAPRYSVDSWRLHPTAVQIDGKKAVRAGGKEPVFPQPTERDVGDDLRQAYLSQQLGLRGDAVHAVCSARPDISVLVQPEAVRHARAHLCKDAAVCQAVVLPHGKDADMTGAV